MVKSKIGRRKNHKLCLGGLGLRRIGQSVLVEDTPSNRGMIERVRYLLRVEENIRVIKQTSLGLRITTSRGIGKKSVDLNHRWTAPIRATFTEGKPNGTWIFVAIDDPQGFPRMVGAFVRTVGSRTLFCPGIEVQIAPVDATESTDERVTVDHLTLDPRRYRDGQYLWSAHVATIDEKRDNPRGVRWSQKETEGWMVPWFSFVIPQFESLEVLPEELFVPFEMPSSDLPSRPKRTLGDYKRPIILQCEAKPPTARQYFLQLDVSVSEDRTPQGLASRTYNFIPEEEKGKPPYTHRWAGQNEFDLLTNKLWIRVMTSVRPGNAERPCLLALRQDDALLL